MSELRDIALVLLGVALTQSDRGRVLNVLPYGSTCKEVDDLLEAIRDQKRKPLADWLAVRGVAMEKGVDAIQAMTDAVQSEVRRQRFRRILSELNAAVRIETVEELRTRLQECLARLDEV